MSHAAYCPRRSVNWDFDRPKGGAGAGLGCVGVSLESSTEALRRSGWSAARGGISSSAGRAFGVSKSKPPVTAILDKPTTLVDLKLEELKRFESFDFDRTICGAAFELAFLTSSFRAWVVSSWLLFLLPSGVST
ncbi:hypothetical protein VM1G_11604 [Cytospora mali]|uniref:Uncharacterized protein n=1 Tax=Cytospora mali TaxID=578113 RepID=A0A194VZI1_CYTMA|nr:hypothetical protein VM1G_11604 [Valsa mali]